MRPFFDRFPDVAARETRIVTAPGGQDLPPGEYGFMEMYCDERGCDCRRVMIAVVRPETGWSKIYATISYGWEDADFYRRWGPHSDPVEMQGPSLNPLGPQTKYSAALMDLFRDFLQSPDYVERLKRHYGMFRETVDQEHAPKNRMQVARRSGRGSNRGRPRGR